MGDQSRDPMVLGCTPCGIRFSSRSTLEAHRNFYCAHRPLAAEDGNTNDGEEKSQKFENQRKAYACPKCSYSADKKVSLNRHMRMHAASPAAPPITIPSAPSTPVNNATPVAPANGTFNEESERYCRNCDIRFNSLKTFRAHKSHYCSTRHVVKDSPTPQVKASPPTSASPGNTPPPQHCLALPTNPILIVPYALFESASVLPAPSLPVTPDGPCYLLPNGSLHPAGPAVSTVLRSVNKPVTPSLTTSNPETASASSAAAIAPLDLSIRKSPVHQDEKVHFWNIVNDEINAIFGRC